MKKFPSFKNGIPIWAASLVGTITCGLISLALSLVITGFVYSEMIGQGSLPIIRYMLQGASGAIGALCALLLARRQYLIVSACSAVGYILLLVGCNMLLFGAGINNIILTSLIVLGAALSVGFLLAYGMGRAGNKIKKYRFG